MTEWLKGCEICNSGLCNRFDELIESGKSQRSAANILVNEQKKEIGEILYSAPALRKRYADNTINNKKVVQNVPKNDTCAVKDLNNLIESDKKYSTIYADPPWQYSNQATRASTDNHYTTMTLEGIANLPISQLTTENAHLHIWTTNAFLFDTKAIMEAWGFEYKSCFVWVKPQMGIGNYWRVSHEFMLFGIKGNQPFLNRAQKSWSEINRTKHSKKPEDVAQKIELVSPAPYLELFGRETRIGWTVWGNEIERHMFNKEAFNGL